MFALRFCDVDWFRASTLSAIFSLDKLDMIFTNLCLTRGFSFDMLASAVHGLLDHDTWTL